MLEYRAVESSQRLSLERTTAERKATGTFYTPRSLTDFIVRRTLAPLVRGRSCEEILALRVVDPSMGSGAFLVAACRYLAQACERALTRAETGHARDGTDEERANLRRRVAERCLYGVDINPMAVQVARLSLWLTTLAADRPLTFLDHHLAVGDSLVGARLRDLSRQPPFAARASRRIDARASGSLFASDAASDFATAILPERFRLALEPADTVEAVRDKERRLEALEAPDTPLARWKGAADLWCAAWFWHGRPITPALFGDLTARVLDRPAALSGREAATWLTRASQIAQQRRFFHWELAFPEVFFDEHGQTRPDAGFDAVLGNPPWDVVRANRGEARGDAGRHLRQLIAFVRDAGIYRNVGRGHPNRYQLFVERALQQLRVGGRFGLVVPGGLLTDQRSGGLRRALTTTTTLDTIVGFDNRAAIFPIHRSTRFALLLGRHAGATAQLRCRFGMTDPTRLDALPDHAEDDPPHWPAIRLDCDVLARLDPEHVTIPDVAGALDLAILLDISRRVPKLSAASGWQVRFGRELNATDDRHHFVPIGPDTATQAGLRVIEGKCLEPFRVRTELARQLVPAHLISALGAGAVASGHQRLAYREVASATNKFTLIAALLPPGCVSTHTVFCAKTALDEESQYCLLGLLNSLTANYLVRRWVSTHVTASVMARLPVPVPAVGSARRQTMVALSKRLCRRGIDHDGDAYARLNALAANLYGVDRDRLAHIIDTFPLIGAAVRQRILIAFDAEPHNRYDGPTP